MNRFRLTLAAFLIAVAAIAAPAVRLSAAPQQPAHATEAASQGHEEAPSHDSWKPAIAKTVNFVILIAVLVYFLRTPVMGYLNGRIGKVREDLVTAAQTREAASRQLAEIDSRLKALPTEIEALKRRGAEDIAAERARIEEEAQVERRRLLEHTRREVEMRLRLAKRELLELTATLAVNIASDLITRSITPDDQARLVDRYAAQLRGAHS
jgi:F-type H+-transporting ATPase subunit b